MRDRSAPRRVPRTIWLIALAHGLLLAVYSVVVPLMRAPDEFSHLDMVILLRDGDPWPSGPGRTFDTRTTSALRHARFDFSGRHGEPPLAYAEAPPRQDRPALEDLEDEPSLADNQQWQHPPAYYYAVASSIRVLERFAPWLSWDQVVHAARLVSVALVTPLPVLAYLTATAVGSGRTVGLTAALVPLSVPQLTHIGSVLNNDTYVVAVLAVLVWLGARVMGGDGSLRTALAVGVVSGLALLGKGFALVSLLYVPAAYAVGARRRRPHVVRRAALHALVAAAVAMAVGGWWWVRNIIRYGTIQPTGARLPPPADDFVADVTSWAVAVPGLLVQRFWGSFGWYQVDLDGTIVIGATAAVGICLAAAFLPLGPDVGMPPRAPMGVLLLPVIGLLVIVVYGGWGYYSEHGLVAGLQGRYLYGGLTGLAVVVATGLFRLLGPGRRWSAVVLGAGVVGIQLHALGVLLDRFWSGPTLRDQLAAFAAWAPYPPPVMLALGALTASAAVAVAAALVFDASVGQRPPPAHAARNDTGAAA